MKLKFYSPKVFLLCFLVLSGCTDNAFDSYAKRRLPGMPTNAVDEPPPSVEPATVISTPSLNVYQDVTNCTDNLKCHLEEMQNQVISDYSINAVIVADSDLLTSANINLAPTIRFEIEGLDESSISNVTYAYTKKDFLGNTLSQTPALPIYRVEDYYSIPIHSSNLGSGVLISAPYETHVVNIKITDDDNRVYSKDITFFLQTNTINPVIIERDSQTLDSSYYKMDADQNSYTIDTVTLKNTLPYDVKMNGSVEVSNKTVAFLQRTFRTQNKTFYDCPGGTSPCDHYNWSIATDQTYNQATAVPIYNLKARRGSTSDDVPITMDVEGEQTILNFEDLLMFGNEEIKLDVVVNFNMNNNVTGDHNNMNMYSGSSYCENLSANTCNCFYMINSNLGVLPFTFATVYISSGQNYTYPNCPTNTAGAEYVHSSLQMYNYPEYSLLLVGRHHLTNTKYTFTTWLKGFESSNDLGTMTKTMDPLERTKGFVNYSVLNPSINYEGYIPGQL